MSFYTVSALSFQFNVRSLNVGSGEYPKGDLVVQGDMPVAKFRILNSAIYYLLRKKISNLVPLRVMKIYMIGLWSFKKV